MLTEEIYRGRFTRKAEAKGYTVTEVDYPQIESYRDLELTPAVAVNRHYSKLKLKTAEEEIRLEPLVEFVCEGYGLEPELATDEVRSDTEDWKDAKTIICHVAVKVMDIRPHTVIKNRLGFKYNSMVNHNLARCERKCDSIRFTEALEEAKAEFA